MASEPFSTAHLDYLERATLDLAGLREAVTPAVPPSLRRLWRVRGVGRSERDSTGLRKSVGEVEKLATDRDPVARLQSVDALIGLCGERIPLAFVVSGTQQGVSIRIGTWSQVGRVTLSAEALDQRQQIIGAALASLYPAIDLVPDAVALPALARSGLALGLPTAKQADTTDGALGLDRLIRAMSGASWAYLVLADPVDDRVTAQLRNSALLELRSVQAAAQAERAPAPLANTYAEFLQLRGRMLQMGFDLGLWRTGVYLLGDAKSYRRLAAVWRGIFSGIASLPEPIRVWDTPEAARLAAEWVLPERPGPPGPGQYRHPLQYQSLLTSTQLAAYVHLPQLETSGFAVRTVPDFDVVPPPGRDGKRVSLGSIVQRMQATEADYAVAIDDLTRHAFVAGMTGAGKSNTIFHLLKQAAKLEASFLVLEPAKTEYRALIGDPALSGKLRVFTLGDELVAPFRLNPFEVVAWPATSIGVHLDLLRSVFSASFGLWTPLPQILEQCLHAIYRDRGWEITTNTNHRLDAKSAPEDAFPTLADLAAKADELVTKLGYEAKVTDDLRAALLTRINGLRVGGKGAMLDVQRSLPMAELVESPSVLELQPLGDDDDKAFLMGLVLIRLYEYRRAGNQSAGLRHLLVIEEAHRLLSKGGERRDQEQADPRGKAVETFGNLLSEIRAYGQGVLIADQIPVKLAPEILKNTNLKIAHRIVATDDRTALAGAMVMDERQSRALATLGTGQAAVFSSGDDAPLLLQVPQAKDIGGSAPPSDAAVRAYMAQASGAAYPGQTATPASALVHNAARALLDDALFRRDFVRLVVSMTEEDGALGRLWNDLVLRAQPLRQAGMDEAELLRAAVDLASAWFAQRRGHQAAWSYADTSELRNRLRDVLLTRLEEGDMARPLTSFRATVHRLHARAFEPFPGCARICDQAPPLCLYRHAVADFIAASKDDLAAEWGKAYSDDGTAGQGNQRAWRVTLRATDELIAETAAQQGAGRRLRLCYVQHLIAGFFPEDRQAILSDLLLAVEKAS
jgi:hypothetical protein